MAIQEGLAKSAGVVSLGTMTSRMLGFIRDMVIGAMFVPWIRDIFFIAFVIPNLFRRLLGEGALSVSFIPVFTEHLANKKDPWKLASSIFNLTLILLVLIAILGVIISPFIIKVIAPGFDMARKILAIKLVRIMFPFVVFICLAALVMGMLNSIGHFAAPAFAPMMLNISMIASVFLFYNKLSQPIVGLAIGVLVGGLAQLLFQLPALIKRGAKYFLTFDYQNPGVRRVGTLMVPVVIGLSATQVNTVVDRMLGSLLAEGSISALYYGNRLIQLPLAIFGIAIATAVFPQLAREAQAKRIDEVKEALRSSLRLVFFTTLPAAVGLIVLGKPIIRLLFERREFTSGDTSATAFALLFYAVGLFAYASIVVIVRTFYSFQDTRTPVKIGCIAMVANIILNLILMRPLAQGGLAFATALAAMINMSLLLWVLRRRIGPFGGANVIGAFGRLLGVSAIMGIVCWLVAHAWEPFATSLGFQVLQVGTGIIVGVATFGLISYLLKIEEMRTVLQLVTKRR